MESNSVTRSAREPSATWELGGPVREPSDVVGRQARAAPGTHMRSPAAIGCRPPRPSEARERLPVAICSVQSPPARAAGLLPGLTRRLPAPGEAFRAAPRRVGVPTSQVPPKSSRSCPDKPRRASGALRRTEPQDTAPYPWPLPTRYAPARRATRKPLPRRLHKALTVLRFWPPSSVTAACRNGRRRA